MNTFIVYVRHIAFHGWWGRRSPLCVSLLGSSSSSLHWRASHPVHQGHSNHALNKTRPCEWFTVSPGYYATFSTNQSESYDVWVWFLVWIASFQVDVTVAVARRLPRHDDHIPCLHNEPPDQTWANPESWLHQHPTIQTIIDPGIIRYNNPSLFISRHVV